MFAGHPRRHPLFPTISEVKTNKNLALSDHLPLLLVIPKENSPAISLVTLNTLGPSAPSGLHANARWETDDETVTRYKRMVKGLMAAISKHQITLLFLQETVPDFIVPILTKGLQQAGEDWDIIADSELAMVTCYNKKRFNCLNTAIPNLEVDGKARNRIRSLILEDVTDNTTIEAHNIWGFYDPFPQRTEQLYSYLLNKKSRSSIALIAGDTNSRLAPLDDHPRNITTGIVPVRMNALNDVPENIQVPDYPDGGFYCDKEGRIHQVKSRVLDYETGDIVEDIRSDEELKSWPEQRMILCLDNTYLQKIVIAGKSIFGYEKALRQELGDENIIFRIAANSFNKKTVAVRFAHQSNDAFLFIKRQRVSDPDFIFSVVPSTDDRDKGRTYCCLFTTLDKVELLHQEIVAYINSVQFKNTLRRQIALLIDMQIKKMTEFSIFNLFLKDSPDKKNALCDLRRQIVEMTFGFAADDFCQFIEDWELVAEKESVTNRDILAQHRNRFFADKRQGKATSAERMLENLKSDLRQQAHPS